MFRCLDVLTSVIVMITLVSDLSSFQPGGMITMSRHPATIAARSGLNEDQQYGCVAPPIHLSSTYNFSAFNQPRAHDYSRRGNPTRDVVQHALAELEGKWRGIDQYRDVGNPAGDDGVTQTRRSAHRPA